MSSEAKWSRDIWLRTVTVIQSYSRLLHFVMRCITSVEVTEKPQPGVGEYSYLGVVKDFRVLVPVVLLSP
jgi:hypothetical protein